MAQKLNKTEVAEKLNQKIDSAIKRLTDAKRDVNEPKKFTMLNLLFDIENVGIHLNSINHELKRLRKEASPLTETEQLLFDAYKDIDCNGFEGGGGLNEEQGKEYDRLRKLCDK